MPRKILVCLDGSDLAEQVLDHATEQADQFNSKVVLLRVINVPASIPVLPYPAAAAGYIAAVEELKAVDEGEAGEYLDRVAEPLRGRGLDVQCVTVEGPPGDAIVSYAKDNDVDLVAIANSGRSGLSRLIFGSVAEKVFKESGLPTLVIRPN